MRLSIVYPVLNQFPLTRTVINYAIKNLSEGSDTELDVINNGSDSPFLDLSFAHTDKKWVIKHEKNIGVYPTFWDVLPVVSGDILAYLHSDLIVCEKGWDKRVLKAFEDDPKLGLIGFIGSDEIDRRGGRGYGTTSNFQNRMYREAPRYLCTKGEWHGSPAHAHGKQEAGLSPAKVVDGCAMIFRRSVLEQISERKDFPPHHFYDRLLSCEVLERGYKVAVLGIACDHISGQTVCNEQKCADMEKEWCEAHGFGNTDPNTNWDNLVYKEAERQFLSEYRDIKHLIPCHI